MITNRINQAPQSRQNFGMAIKISDKEAVTKYIEKKAGTSARKATKLTNQLIEMTKKQEGNPYDVNIDIGIKGNLIATVTDSQSNNATIRKFGLNLLSPIGPVKRAINHADKKNAVRKIASQLNELG